MLKPLIYVSLITLSGCSTTRPNSVMQSFEVLIGQGKGFGISQKLVTEQNKVETKDLIDRYNALKPAPPAKKPPTAKEKIKAFIKTKIEEKKESK